MLRGECQAWSAGQDAYFEDKQIFKTCKCKYQICKTMSDLSQFISVTFPLSYSHLVRGRVCIWSFSGEQLMYLKNGPDDFELYSHQLNLFYCHNRIIQTITNRTTIYKSFTLQLEHLKSSHASPSNLISTAQPTRTGHRTKNISSFKHSPNHNTYLPPSPIHSSTHSQSQQ